MARIEAGEKITELSLPDYTGGVFSLDAVKGKRYLLSFFRFASCPFCNLRVHQLVSHFQEFGDQFTVVAIFDADQQELSRSALRHQAPFPILADKDNRYYRRFGVERSYLGVLKGMLMRFHQLCYSVVVKGNIPLKIGGHVATMPLNLLVDEDGVVKYAHYGRDEGDHLPLAVVKKFALTGDVPD
ncbi:redoxin domain-containing protein [Spongiibacter taiwanensis]|uniref:peroxiredoxin family protein n=1 Tax=Spongiibacter taiwanensis TaxID=1748242 RepID=UPI002035ACE0|nr:redoxin domain-containing protein [Spongiibacter taiwanensis]USA42087.1 redoxin domain-containing protein [Spongiibacter taiwanensis]